MKTETHQQRQPVRLTYGQARDIASAQQPGWTPSPETVEALARGDGGRTPRSAWHRDEDRSLIQWYNKTRQHITTRAGKYSLTVPASHWGRAAAFIYRQTGKARTAIAVRSRAFTLAVDQGGTLRDKRIEGYCEPPTTDATQEQIKTVSPGADAQERDNTTREDGDPLTRQPPPLEPGIYRAEDLGSKLSPAHRYRIKIVGFLVDGGALFEVTNGTGGGNDGR